MEIIGKTTIHPALFFTGKICGYTTWIWLLLDIFRVPFFAADHDLLFQIPALVLCAIGLVFTAVSLFNLGSSTRLGLPTSETSLKTEGLYRFSRNPMYLGFDLLTLSAILYTLNIAVALLGIYSIVIYHFIIRGEEKFLTEKFGKQYGNYCKKVRRYL